MVSPVGHPLWSHHLVGQPSLSPFGQPSWSSKLVTQVGHPSWSTQLVNQVGQPLVTPVGQPSWSSKLVTPFFSKCFRVFNKSMFKNLKSLLKNGIFYKKKGIPGIFCVRLLRKRSTFPNPIFKSRIIFGKDFPSRFQSLTQNLNFSTFGVRKSRKTVFFRELILVCGY